VAYKPGSQTGESQNARHKVKKTVAASLTTIGTWLKSYLANSLRQTVKHTSIAAVFIAVVGYYFTYQDRIDSRQQNAWDVVRKALDWSETHKKWGNIGQIEAFEILTRDCDSWWIDTPLKNLLGRDCANLKSLSLMAMDFGGLNAPGATFSHSYFACSNFAAAHLARARLDHTAFMAATLADADFSGADLTNSCLFLADVSGATFDRDTTIDDPRNLLKACIKRDANGTRYEIKAQSNARINAIATQIADCPSDEKRCDLLGERNGWSCGN
jgi:hypothetical protein